MRTRRRKIISWIIKMASILASLVIFSIVIIMGANKVKNSLFNDIKFDNNKFWDTNDNMDANDNIREDEIQTVLKSMVKQDKRIKSILESYNDYPAELLDMLSRNIEMTDFVLDYPNKKGEVYADNIGEIVKDEMPLLLQYDKRWGYGDYGESMIAISGCGPTALAMVIAKLTNNNEITPYKVAKFAEDKGYYVSGIGTTWDLFTKGSERFGIKGKEIPLSESSIYNALESGNPIICSMRAGDFTTTGHIIVLSAIEEGKIVVHDSNSTERSNHLWDYKTLEGQIKNLWAFAIN